MADDQSVLRRKTQRTRGLSAPVLAMRPAWLKAIDDALDSISNIVGHETMATSVKLNSSSTDNYARENDIAGIVLPIAVNGIAGYFARVSEKDSLILATYMLRANDKTDIGEEATELDDLLMGSFLRPIFEQIYATFSVSVTVDETRDVIREWPHFRKADIRNFLLITIELTIGEEDKVNCDLCLPKEEEAFAEAPETRPPPEIAMLQAAQLSPVELSAELDCWDVEADELRSFKPGFVLPLHSGTMDNIRLILRSGRRNILLARGQHGRSGRNQALQVSSIEEI